MHTAAPASPSDETTVDAAWREMLAANDRLHDGQIMAVGVCDAAELTIQCYPSTYRQLAVQHHPSVGDRGVRLLGVKARIFGVDRDNRGHVLIARRGTQTRVYGGMWEIGPGGGIEPLPNATAITHDDIVRSLIREAQEEMGLKVAPADCRHVIAAILDEWAYSVDLIMPVVWPGIVDPRRGLCAADGCEWEYLDAAWIALDDWTDFAAKHASAITPPTLAVARLQQWGR